MLDLFCFSNFNIPLALNLFCADAFPRTVMQLGTPEWTWSIEQLRSFAWASLNEYCDKHGLPHVSSASA
jgi:hypothetical protein